MPVIDLGSVVGPQGVQGVPGVPGVQGIQGNPGPNQVTDQTSTNLNGVLFGSQSKVTVKPVDATPTADSGNLVSSGGVKIALDGKANPGQLAYVETGTTASQAYAVGEYFCWNGLLYRAKTAIGNGDTFTENTNCEQVTKGGLNDVNETTLYNISLNSGYSVPSGSIAKYGKTKNGLVTVSAFIQHGTTDISPFEPFTLPDGFRPRSPVTFLARNDNHGYLVMGCIGTSGIATFYSLANTFGSGATFNTGLAFRNVYFDVTFLA